MPWCPKCGSEYRSGAQRCSDCDEPLVPQKPPSVIELKPAERSHAEFLPVLSRNVAFFRRHLVDPEHGGWYSSADASDKSKGSEWKLDYHVTNMCLELLRYEPVARNG
jgi:hypothetical protein